MCSPRIMMAAAPKATGQISVRRRRTSGGLLRGGTTARCPGGRAVQPADGRPAPLPESGSGSPHWGLGHATRSQHAYCADPIPAAPGMSITIPRSHTAEGGIAPSNT